MRSAGIGSEGELERESGYRRIVLQVLVEGGTGGPAGEPPSPSYGGPAGLREQRPCGGFGVAMVEIVRGIQRKGRVAGIGDMGGTPLRVRAP